MRIEAINAHPTGVVKLGSVRRYVKDVLKSERTSRADITVVFVDDRTSRRLNRRFLAHDRPTDVLAFPLGERPNLEGEIYVNLDKARRQARTYQVSLENETARLVIHGTLHLLGYDDRKSAQARRMKSREDRLVGRLTGEK